MVTGRRHTGCRFPILPPHDPLLLLPRISGGGMSGKGCRVRGRVCPNPLDGARKIRYAGDGCGWGEALSISKPDKSVEGFGSRMPCEMWGASREIDETDDAGVASGPQPPNLPDTAKEGLACRAAVAVVSIPNLDPTTAHPVRSFASQAERLLSPHTASPTPPRTLWQPTCTPYRHRRGVFGPSLALRAIDRKPLFLRPAAYPGHRAPAALAPSFDGDIVIGRRLR